MARIVALAGVIVTVIAMAAAGDPGARMDPLSPTPPPEIGTPPPETGTPPPETGTPPPETGTPPPDPVAVHIPAMGSGPCPTGPVSVGITPDNGTLTLAFSDLVAGVGDGFGPTDSRRNCQIPLLLRVPPGYRYTVVGLDQQGYARLAAGAVGRIRQNHYLEGTTSPPPAAHLLTGPVDGEWRFTDPPTGDQVYTPCGELRHLNLNWEIRVALGTSEPSTPSLLRLDSADGTPQVRYHLHWQRCPTAD